MEFASNSTLGYVLDDVSFEGEGGNNIGDIIIASFNKVFPIHCVLLVLYSQRWNNWVLTKCSLIQGGSANVHGRSEPKCVPIVSANMEKLPSSESDKNRYVIVIIGLSYSVAGDKYTLFIRNTTIRNIGLHFPKPQESYLLKPKKHFQYKCLKCFL